MPQSQDRDNPLDTDKEVIKEAKESFDDISKVTKNLYFSLSPSVVKKVVDSFSDKELIKILKELSKKDLVDLEKFTQKLLTLIDNKNISEIVEMLAITGEIPAQYSTPELNELLNREIFKNDSESIQLLNQIEENFLFQELRYELQKLLVKHLPRNISSKYDLTFYDLTVSQEERDLLEEQKKTTVTLSKFDDYLVEFKLSLKRNYEAEEQIYLGKKVLEFARTEGKTTPAMVISELDRIIQNNQDSLKYLGHALTKESKDEFSFHQVMLKGSNYNFAYFNSDISDDADFHQLPMLDNKPILLLLHGLSQDWACWRWIIGTLKDRYQILVPDMNGFGDSDELVLFHTLSNYTGYISNFLNKLGVKEYDVMGHSAGSFTTQQIFDSPMLQPNHAVLISSSAHLEMSSFNNALIRFLKVTSLNSFYMRTAYKALGIIDVKSNEPLEAYTKEEKLNRIKKSSPRSLAELIDFIMTEYNIEGRKFKLETKILVVVGEADPVVTPSSTKKLIDIFEGAKLISIPNAGHSEVLSELPKHHLEELTQFLNS
ncbi:MAG: alpha/beta hydrolase [Candidatus Dojkabacteria bacterium]